jgi:hypothetical protein
MNDQIFLWANTAPFPRDFTERRLPITFQRFIPAQTFLVSQYDVKIDMKHYKINPIYEDRLGGIHNKKGELETQVKFYPKILKWKDHLENLVLFTNLPFMVYVTTLILAKLI